MPPVHSNPVKLSLCWVLHLSNRLRRPQSHLEPILWHSDSHNFFPLFRHMDHSGLLPLQIPVRHGFRLTSRTFAFKRCFAPLIKYWLLNKVRTEHLKAQYHPTFNLTKTSPQFDIHLSLNTLSYFVKISNAAQNFSRLFFSPKFNFTPSWPLLSFGGVFSGRIVIALKKCLWFHVYDF